MLFCEEIRNKAGGRWQQLIDLIYPGVPRLTPQASCFLLPKSQTRDLRLTLHIDASYQIFNLATDYSKSDIPTLFNLVVIDPDLRLTQT